MKIFYSPNSPFVRKVMMAAIELEADNQIEKAPVTLSPYEPNPAVTEQNPLGKIPVLMTDEHGAIFDSIVICEYLSTKFNDSRLFPLDSKVRWRALTLNAVADGMLEAAMLSRFENARPEEYRYAKWSDAQLGKIRRAFAYLESNVPHGVNIGAISVAAAIGWLDFRFPDLGWRSDAPTLATWFEFFAQRPSFKQTVHPT